MVAADNKHGNEAAAAEALMTLMSEQRRQPVKHKASRHVDMSQKT